MTKRNCFWSDDDLEAAARAWDRIAKEDAAAAAKRPEPMRFGMRSPRKEKAPKEKAPKEKAPKEKAPRENGGGKAKARA